MDFFIQRFSQTSLGLFLGILFFMSFPAFSATSVSTFTTISLAFILGLSFPVTLIALLYKSKLAFKLRFFILQTFSLMGILYFVAFYGQAGITIPLTFSMLYLVFLYFSKSHKHIDSPINIAIISHAMVLILAATYIAVICFYSNTNGYILWVVASGIVLALIAVKIKYACENLATFMHEIVMQWGPAFYFSVAVFLWVYGEIDTQWFIINSVGSYAILLLINSWKVIKKINKENAEHGGRLGLAQMGLAKTPKDVSTNLPSQQEAVQVINKLLKNQKNTNLAIIVFKPINFKQVNKILGHHNSDILLLQLAYCLQKSVENNDRLINFNSRNEPIRVARLQGLHFLVALQLKENDTYENDLVEQLCQELMLAVPDAMSFKSFSLNFELTFGISFLGEQGNGLSQVIAHAEDALLSSENKQLPLSYFNKDEVIYTERHLLQMERLKNDIIEDNLYWYVQPQTRLRDRKLVGFELLVQWHNTDNVPLTFQDFIDIAEHSGEIYLLTKQMITRAFKLILKLQRVSNYETVSIKLWSQYLLEPDLVSFIEKQIATYNVPAKYLIIELPEEVVLSAGVRAKTIIDELKSLNINIGISDFSGSYESLRYIRKMAVHQVKIDCEHIGRTDDDSEKAIITALVDLTQKMNLPLIGTSINDKLTEQAFTLIGGELAQGDVVDKGVTTDKIDTWVTTWNGLYNPA
ncbi:EAL domain-containing protein [Colwellia sp. RE-S-Sl-9]